MYETNQFLSGASPSFIMNVSGNITDNTIYSYGNNGYTGGSLIVNNAVTRRVGAFRKPKKVRGSMEGANNKNDRITGLVSPIAVFDIIKGRFNFMQEHKLTKRLELVLRIMEDGKASGQIALVESLQKRFGAVIREQEMVACGFNQFVTDTVLKRFIESCGKIIKLTPIKNYVRIIPKAVLSKKTKADNLKLFDGYVVLHTDPNDTSVKKTEAEKKDPILFGVIADSNKYYHIGSWEDELCHITFEDILDTLTRKEAKGTNLENDLETKLKEIIEG